MSEFELVDPPAPDEAVGTCKHHTGIQQRISALGWVLGLIITALLVAGSLIFGAISHYEDDSRAGQAALQNRLDLKSDQLFNLLLPMRDQLSRVTAIVEEQEAAKKR